MTDQTSTRARAHLLPCPFCGCADVILTFYSGAPAIFCTNDDCEALMGGEEYSGDKARLIKCWNRRAPTPDSVDARRYRFVRLRRRQLVSRVAEKSLPRSCMKASRAPTF
ncbi:Lar family restriction alleviation protein [Burkholderia gladioli]